ncbi:hypothetical protein ACOZB2_03330 [Pantoea endophytica]
MARIDKIIPCGAKMEHISFLSCRVKSFSGNRSKNDVLKGIKKALADNYPAKAHFYRF